MGRIISDLAEIGGVALDNYRCSVFQRQNPGPAEIALSSLIGGGTGNHSPGLQIDSRSQKLIASNSETVLPLSQGLLSNLPMEHSVPCTQAADRQRMDSQRGSGGTRTV